MEGDGVGGTVGDGDGAAVGKFVGAGEGANVGYTVGDTDAFVGDRVAFGLDMKSAHFSKSLEHRRDVSRDRSL